MNVCKKQIFLKKKIGLLAFLLFPITMNRTVDMVTSFLDRHRVSADCIGQQYYLKKRDYNFIGQQFFEP